MPEQPGLEVAYHHVQPSLEVYSGHESSSLDKEAVPQYDKEAVAHQHPAVTEYVPAPPYLDPAAQKKPASRKKLLWIIGTLVLVVVILAAVLGGVLGSKASKSASESAAAAKEAGPNAAGGSGGGDSKNSTSTDIPRPKTLRQGSSLSVTGWRNMDGNVEKYLAYQTPQDELRLMKAPGGNDSWESPMSFNASPKPGAQIGLTTIIFETVFKPQIEIFYTAKSSRLLGVSFNEDNTNAGAPKFGDDSINTYKIFTGLNSSLATYWPWILQQDSDGTLVHTRDQLGDGALMSPQSIWDVNRLNATALASSSLAVVPLSTNFNKMAVQGGYAVFYQAVDGSLAVEIPSLEQAVGLFGENYTLSWPESIPKIVMPKRAAIAAFSVARDEAEELVNTYVMWVDENQDGNVLYTDMSSGSPVWRIVQPDVLKGIDEESSLACLSLGCSPFGPSGGAIPLEVGSEEGMRCFFVKGGVVQEVKLAGGSQTEWREVGVVPIP